MDKIVNKLLKSLSCLMAQCVFMSVIVWVSFYLTLYFLDTLFSYL